MAVVTGRHFSWNVVPDPLSAVWEKTVPGFHANVVKASLGAPHQTGGTNVAEADIRQFDQPRDGGSAG
jgi:hypothetical protein